MSYIGVQPGVGQYRKLDDISGSFNGVTTTFTTSVGGINVTAGSPQQLLVSVGGVIQQPVTDYSTNTNSITFSTAPAGGLDFFAVLMGDAINVGIPSDGSVTSAKLNSDLTIDLALGSASAPSLTFDTNTGLYSPGADQVALSTNGSERLRITSAGLVGIGTTTPGSYATGFNDLVVGNHTGNHGITIASQSTSTGRLLFADGTGGTEVDVGEILYNHANNSLSIATNRSTAVTIDSSGRLLVGTSSSSDAGTVVLQGNSGNTAANGSLNLARGTAAPADGAVLGEIKFSDSGHTKSGSIICARDGGTWTSGTSQPSRLVFSTTADGASSPTERMRISSDGNLLHGTTTVFTQSTNSGSGVRIANGGITFLMRSEGPPLFVNRNTDDGTLVDFRQAGTQEGSISVSGTTVSYNGAHLSRWSQLPSDAERTEILRGSVLSNIDEMCEWGEEDNEQLNRMKVSDVEGDKNVSGVFQAWDDDDETYTNDFYCAMTGDFIIRIGAGVTVERGDLLMSAGDGTAKPQEDDIIRSMTIAKVTSTNVSCTYDDGSYCVPCVLMAC